MTRHRDLYFIPFHELNLPPSTFLRGNFTYASLPVTHPTHRLACNVVGAAIGELTTLKEKRDYIDEQIDERLRAVAAPKPDAGDFCPDEGHMYLYHQFVSGSSKGSTVGIGYWQRKVRSLSLHLFTLLTFTMVVQSIWELLHPFQTRHTTCHY